MNDVARGPTVPLLRWGVSIGRLAAEHYGADRLSAKLGWLEPRLAPESILTMWAYFHDE